ncbi:MAG: mechanosensitive ion channel family protein, partial [Nannocystaceae bacterium]
MPLHRRAFALFFCLFMLIPGLSAAAMSANLDAPPAPTAQPARTAAGPARTAAPAQPAAAADSEATAEAGESGWVDDLSAMVQEEAFPILKTVGLALALFIAGWLLAKLIAYAVFQALMRTQLDDKLAEVLRLDLLFQKD